MQNQESPVTKARAAIRKRSTTAELVDQLGEIKARLARLKDEEEELVEALKAQGVGVYSGSLFDANIFNSSSSKLDKEALCKKHKLMEKWLAACTTTKDTVVCKVTARVAR